MIVDSSAIIALIHQEPEASRIAELLGDSPETLMSAGTYLETAVVLDSKRDPVLSRQLDSLLENASVRVVEVTVQQARIGRAAYQDFGRGSGHPASLNFGDCFAYALAKETGRPLLFKGDDFTHTDVLVALPPDSS